MRLLRRRRLVLTLVALLCCAAGAGAWATGSLERIEGQSVDARFALRGERAAPPDVAVVGIDDRTFQETGLRWPFPRRVHARLVERLERAGARVIAYDVQFTEADETDPEGDLALVDAVERAGNVVLATTEVDERGGSNVFGYIDPGTPMTPDEFLREIGVGVGSANLPLDRGGVVRKLAPDVEGLPSFALVAARRARGSALRWPDGDREAWIDFHGSSGSVDHVSFVDVLRGRVGAERLAGRVAVVGSTAPSLQDVKPTSTSEAMSGPEIQAQAISTALRDFPLEETGGAVDLALIALLALVAPLAGMVLSLGRTIALAVAAGAAFLTGSALTFAVADTIVPVVYPMTALALATLGTAVVQGVTAAFDREYARLQFARFVPSSVVDEVLACADDDLRLRAVERECTIMFSDIRGFTTLSETLPPARVVQMLNGYLEEMTDAILCAGGTLVAYMGDGIMAVFGAPLARPDHADCALEAAREMIGPRLEKVNARLTEEGVPRLRIGVGINTGTVVSGAIGSSERMEYTTIGDPVNTASRIEGMTKDVGCSLLLAESTRDALTRPPEDLVAVGERAVRGRQGAVRLWSLAASVTPTRPLTAAARPEGEDAQVAGYASTSPRRIA